MYTFKYLSEKTSKPCACRAYFIKNTIGMYGLSYVLIRPVKNKKYALPIRRRFITSVYSHAEKKELTPSEFFRTVS